MGLTEVAAGTWRLESLVGPRNVYQYVLADGGQALIVDTGMTATPREVILPALRSVRDCGRRRRDGGRHPSRPRPSGRPCRPA